MTFAPGGRPRATQSLIALPPDPGTCGTQPLVPAGIIGFGVGVQVAPGRMVAGGGTIVGATGAGLGGAVGVGRGLDVGGAVVADAMFGACVVANAIVGLAMPSGDPTSRTVRSTRTVPTTPRCRR